jgi:hypothetical protein
MSSIADKLLMTCFISILFIMINFSIRADNGTLSFNSQQQFENFHTSLIHILIEKEKKERFPGRLLTPKESNELQSSFYQFFIDTAHAGSKKGKMCFFGGWPSFRSGKKNLCRPPWEFAKDAELKKFGPRYDRKHWCGSDTLFRCNPLIFGPAESGKGTCVTISNYNNVTELCHDHLKKSKKDTQLLYRKFEKDAEFRRLYIGLSEEALQFCEDNPKYDACDFLKNTVYTFYKAACDGKIPDLDVRAVTSAQTQIGKVLSHIAKNQKKSNSSKKKRPATIASLKPKPSKGLIGTQPKKKPKKELANTTTKNEPSDHHPPGDDNEETAKKDSTTDGVRLIKIPTQPEVEQAKKEKEKIEQEKKVERIKFAAAEVEKKAREKRQDEVAAAHLRYVAQEKKIFKPSRAPGNSSRVNTHVTTVKESEAKMYGFYTYFNNKRGRLRRFATEKTAWQVIQAGRKLVATNSDIYMGVGNISRSGGGRLRPHSTHRKGRDVDLQLITSDGRAIKTTVWYKSYSRSKTAEMLINLISIDPSNIKRIIVNDPKLHSLVRAKYKVTFQTDRSFMRIRKRHQRNNKKSMPAHDHHIHVTFKE